MRKYVFFGMIVKISICVFFIKLNFGLLVYSYNFFNEVNIFFVFLGENVEFIVSN